MKLVPLALAASVAVNASLAWLLLRDSPAAAPKSGTPAALHVATAATPAATAAAGAAPSATTASGVALRDRLRALGFPEEVVRAAVRAQLEARRLERERELRRAHGPAAPWLPGSVTAGDFNREQDRELAGLRNAERDELIRLFGPAGALGDHDLEPYAFLPPDKAARIAALDRDYADLRRDAADKSTGAEARERERLLTAERDREVAALLTPDELAHLQQRESDAGRTLANRFKYFEPTDAESAALYALQQAYNEKFPPSPGMPSGDNAAARREASQKLAEDTAAALGPDRFAAWQLAQRSEYQALVDLQRRFSVPQPAIDTVVQLPAQTSTAANRIAEDTTLSVDQKKSALVDLANQTRAQVRAVLGNDFGNAYLTAASGQWLDFLDRGMIYTISPTGGMSIRTISSPRPPPPGP